MTPVEAGRLAAAKANAERRERMARRREYEAQRRRLLGLQQLGEPDEPDEETPEEAARREAAMSRFKQR